MKRLRARLKSAVADGVSEISKGLVPFVSNAVLAILGALVWEFFEPFSAWWVFAIVCIALFFVLLQLKHRLVASVLVAGLIALIVIRSLTVSYFIASDHNGFHYRTVDGLSYLEFPQRLSFLKSIVNRIGRDRLITVIQCDDAKIALLPLLPYQPLVRKDVVDDIGFRRLPQIRFHRTELTIRTTIRQSQGDPPHSAFGLAFGFSSGDDNTTQLTTIFPRSLACRPLGFPLIPILEMLPWIPDDTDSLIKAVARIETVRNKYPEQPITFDDLLSLRMPQTNNGYSALLDYSIYRFGYEMFAGNIFVQVRAKLANDLCTVTNSHQSVFSKPPFSALSKAFLSNLIGAFGSSASIGNIRNAMPACPISSDLLDSSHKQDSTVSRIPFASTFAKCLEANGNSMKECLAKKDAELDSDCNDSQCAPSASNDISDEIRLDAYDDKFFEPIVVTKQGAFSEIESIDPIQCPELRDRAEEVHFVDWWITRARALTIKPAECTPTWREEYARQRGRLRSALACGRAKRIQPSSFYEENPELMDILFELKCNGNVSADTSQMAKYMSSFFEQLDFVIADLHRHSAFLGGPESESLVAAFQIFKDLGRNVCGDQEPSACLASYRVWQDYDRIANSLKESLGVSNLKGGDKAAFLDALAQLNNKIVNMAICDLLQDQDFSRETKYDRVKYCDSHDLRGYRLIASHPVMNSMERGGNPDDPSLFYQYESGTDGRSWEVDKFLDK